MNLDNRAPRSASLHSNSWQFRQDPEHFEVNEHLYFAPNGCGEHILSRIRRADMSTPYVEKKISEQTGVPLRMIRHAGLKDRAATATQWFSWPERLQRRPLVSTEDLEVIESSRQEHALSVGHVRHNDFRLLLTGPPPPASLPPLRFPNFFGRQRFGNTDPGDLRAWVDATFKNPTKMAISCLQSALFNDYLQGLRATTGDRPGPEEIWTRVYTKRFFAADLEPEILARFEAGEIAPTGPIFGYKMPSPQVEELDFLAQVGLKLDDFRQFGKLARGTRRARIVHVENLQWEPGPHLGTSVMRFSLPSGSYATVFLLALFRNEILNSPSSQWPDFRQEVNLGLLAAPQTHRDSAAEGTFQE